MPVFIGGNGVGEYLQRERRDRFLQIMIPKSIAERGEQERRGLSGNARERQQDRGEYPPESGWKHDIEDHLPFGDP